MTSRRILTPLAALVATLILATCSDGSDGVDSMPWETSTTAATTSTTLAAATTSTTYLVTEGTVCYEAHADAVAAVEAGLRTTDAARLGEAFQDIVGRYHYVAANIYDADDNRSSSSDVWVITDGTVYSLSGSARDLSSFPDGRELGLSAGDEVGTALQACVQDA